MGDLYRFLEARGLSDVFIAAVLNLVFLLLVALPLWALDRWALALRLAKGYYIFWAVFILTAVLVDRIQRLLRVDADTHIDAFVLSNFAHCVLMLTGWSAFAALAVREFTAGSPVWVSSVLYFVGFLSSHVAFIVIISVYTGRIYKLVNACAALVSFVVFALWPAGGRAVFGWFFHLFAKT